MQFSVIRTRCAVRFKDPANNVVTDAQWKDYVNQRYANVLGNFLTAPWTNTITTSLVATAETRAVTLPVDAWHVQSVYNSTALVKMEPLEGTTEHLRYWPDLTEDGTPVNYRMRNNTIELYPLPSVQTTLRVEYLANIAQMVNDTDLPVFPANFHQTLLVEGALADAYLDDGNLNQYKTHEGVYQDALKALNVWIGESQTERYYEVTDNFF
ncbi:MAG TPA: hypothetical protein VN903_37190 [Polyangia bacterium]|nr:hypothetical protein [Polyangia bacterium]